MSRYYAWSATIIVALTMMAAIAFTPVAAHESQTVEGYELSFGGADEPLITDERMWLEIRITDEDGEPMSDLEDSLTWRLQHMDAEESVELEVSEKHGQPGVYEAAVVFTEPGEYTLHMEGSIGDTEVHTHFETEVQDHTDLMYPEVDDEAEPADSQAQSSLWTFIGGIGIGVAALLAVVFLYRRQ